MRSDGAIRSFLLVFAAMVTCANGPAVGQGAAAGDNPAIYRGADREQRLLDGARKEGQVTVYSSMIADQALRPILNGFQAKYPFVKAQYVRDDPPQQLQKVMAEARAGRVLSTFLKAPASRFRSVPLASISRSGRRRARLTRPTIAIPRGTGRRRGSAISAPATIRIWSRPGSNPRASRISSTRNGRGRSPGRAP